MTVSKCYDDNYNNEVIIKKIMIYCNGLEKFFVLFKQKKEIDKYKISPN